MALTLQDRMLGKSRTPMTPEDDKAIRTYTAFVSRGLRETCQPLTNIIVVWALMNVGFGISDG